MIKYTKGNLLEAPVEALVNTVNEVGVMGKGVALMFREAFPDSAEEYQEAGARGEVHVGRVLVTHNAALVGPRWILHFPTKKHWRNPSRLEWIREGLRDLVRVVRKNGIRSLALPPLGCGSGGLEWTHVRREIEAAFAELPDVDVLVYEPVTTYQNAPKRTGVEELTPARALVAELVRRYAVLGLECSNLEIQKLVWFLRGAINKLGLDDPLKLDFVANKYGPYADRLRHLLDGLDGSYLHCEKRLADARPLEPIWFEDSKREVVSAYLTGVSARRYVPALEKVAETIDGFESPFGMELLATVDWLLSEKKCEPTVAAIKRGLESWPGGKSAALRKRRLFDDGLLQLALNRLA
jgi:O-acetyl-ADP-ribose deacetylase (regulator of RNase III)